MGYIPTQDLTGNYLMQGMQARSQGIAQGLQSFLQQRDQRQKENEEFQAKFKTAMGFLGEHEKEFNLPEGALKALQNDPNLSTREKYLRATGYMNNAILEHDMKAKETENKLREAQALEARARAASLMLPQGKPQNLWNIEELQKKYPVEQWDVQAVPIPDAPPGTVEVKSINARAPIQPKIDAVPAGGEIWFKDEKGNIVRREKVTPAVEPGYRPTAEGAVEPVPGGSVAQKREDTARANAERVASQNVDNDIFNKQIDEAISLASKPGTTGVIGVGAAALPVASEARRLSTLLDGIRSQVALNRINSMKAASPTGATGFGQMNAKELGVATDSLGKLDQAQNEALVRSLKDIKDAVNSMHGRLIKDLSGELPSATTAQSEAPKSKAAYVWDASANGGKGGFVKAK